MIKSILMRVTIGSSLFFITGFVGLLVVITYLVFILDITDSEVIGDMIRSHPFKNIALLFTLISMILSSWVATRKLNRNLYLTTAILIFICCLIITAGPIRYLIIHNNYLPILVGGILGAAISATLAKSMQAKELSSDDQCDMNG
ncbi:hypothetical protein H9C73_15730 [Marinobacterium sp. AK62]|uniref:Uncharacterized protein n=1 Tax=Marinobacterium alkalitolerans TaxID=1542925 RepID=A0ABS3ZGP8_9GAMM|nr:hypothetical protein [Marinobacterium alkalitolerans]MBP0050174.1 hypothetical protein [Marinobacterium alkalitolerans]